MNPNGEASNNDRTLVDRGFPGCPDRAGRKPDPPPSAYTNGVVTPHAAFLGLRWRPRRGARVAARARGPRRLHADCGFYDAVNVQTGDRLRPTCRSTRA